MNSSASSVRRKALTSLDRVVSFEFPTHAESARGSLTVVQSYQDIPFAIARIFYIYGAPSGCERGAHAHRETEQVLIAASGSFSLQVSNKHESKTFALQDANRAIYIPPMIWARLYNFSDDAVCLVLASSFYDPGDYVQNWDKYISAVDELSQ